MLAEADTHPCATSPAALANMVRHCASGHNRAAACPAGRHFAKEGKTPFARRWGRHRRGQRLGV